MVKLTPYRKDWLNGRREGKQAKIHPRHIYDLTSRYWHPLRRRIRLSDEEPDFPEEEEQECRRR